MPRPMSRRLAVILASATFAVGIPLGAVMAGIPEFNDVPPSNPFYNDITALANSGVTGGCGGGNYCPKQNVTREQMAAFMNRLGALSPSKTPVVNADKLDGNDSTDFVMHGQEVTIQIDPVSMVARVPSQDTVVGRSLGSGGVYLEKTSTIGGMVAAVQVPVGAVLKSANVYLEDTAAGDISVELLAIDMTAGAFDTIGNVVTSTGTGGHQSKYTLLGNHVLLASESLSLSVLDANDTSHLFYGASITYFMP
jgi:S-layer homology domain